MIFRLRGRTTEQILEALRARRAEQAEAEDELEAEVVVPLTETLDNFWELGQPLTHLSFNIKPPVTPFPVLKRLGQPSFLDEDLIEMLGPAYQAMTDKAITTAFGEESETDDGPSRDTVSEDE